MTNANDQNHLLTVMTERVRCHREDAAASRNLADAYRLRAQTIAAVADAQRTEAQHESDEQRRHIRERHAALADHEAAICLNSAKTFDAEATRADSEAEATAARSLMLQHRDTY